MSLLLALSISTGILSGLLVWLTDFFDIASWLVFLGATSYFACTDKGMKGLVQVWLTNFSGTIWAMLIIVFSTYLAADFAPYATTAIFAFAMCFQAKFNVLKFIPGTFIGAAAIFSSNGEWMVTIIALFIGAIVGFLMTYTGEQLHKWSEHRSSDSKSQLSENGRSKSLGIK
ncbi:MULTISPECIES: DUF1097 domain-containing protein [Psychromonas]|uniref:DUF1097 domain-containing protein n=1 Tax=Psychromonas TaxID=67572 RepID=UPI0004028EBC|nr:MULTISPECIES: DUF1097 domain-containing protein [Psychromonas]MBB1272153.1 DUF1097 domain-containing protein [Psychromonas sp. SR45-3]